MAISESTITEVENLLKKYLQSGKFEQVLDLEAEEDDEFAEKIRADFFVKNVRAEGDNTILFDLDADVECPPFAQQDAEILIDEEWVPDVIARVQKEVDGDFDLMSQDGEVSYEDE